jgi:hypothetical protein
LTVNRPPGHLAQGPIAIGNPGPRKNPLREQADLFASLSVNPNSCAEINSAVCALPALFARKAGDADAPFKSVASCDR